MAADEDRVVVIPLDMLEETLEKMKAVAVVEETMQAAIRRGASAAELASIISKKKPKKA